MKKSVKFRLVTVGLLLLLIWPAALSAEVTSRDLMVKIGETQVNLLNPSGLIRVDGSTERTDRALAEFGTEGVRTLSFYAEPITWQVYKKSLEEEGPSAILDFYAFINTPEDFVDEDLSPADFAELKGLILADQGLSSCEEGERHVTCRMNAPYVLADGRPGVIKGIVTFLLVNGKILNLNSFSSDKNQFAEQFEPGALEWRDVYLEITKP